MATLTISPEQNMMNMIRVSIEKDIANGNCKPMEATRRYNNTARSMGLPPATDDQIKKFKNIRATYNAARRRARAAAGQEFRPVPPPRSIRRRAPTDNNVPDVPEEEGERGGGESKTSEPPIATNVVPIYNEWEIDPDIPYAIAV